VQLQEGSAKERFMDALGKIHEIHRSTSSLMAEPLYHDQFSRSF
jgi:hypothetical protein